MKEIIVKTNLWLDEKDGFRIYHDINFDEIKNVINLCDCFYVNSYIKENIIETYRYNNLYIHKDLYKIKIIINISDIYYYTFLYSEEYIKYINDKIWQDFVFIIEKHNNSSNAIKCINILMEDVKKYSANDDISLSDFLEYVIQYCNKNHIYDNISLPYITEKFFYRNYRIYKKETIKKLQNLNFSNDEILKMMSNDSYLYNHLYINRNKGIVFIWENKDIFSVIRVSMYISIADKKERYKIVKENINKLFKIAIKMLENNKTFKRINVPINYLSAKPMLSKDGELTFSFYLKKELNLINNNKDVE